MNTVKAWLESRGRSYPAADAQGMIGAEKFEALGLPMVVACTHCEMTMVLSADRACDAQGRVFCDDCAEVADDGSDQAQQQGDYYRQDDQAQV